MSANVSLSDTCDQWRVKNNELIVMTQTDGSDNFIKLTNTTNSTSNTTGSIISTGGLGITKSAVIGGNLNVHGNIHANGAISADGSITLGDADTDNIVFNADINSSLIPNTNGSFDIGNTTQYWSNGFFESVKLTAATDLGMTALVIDANDEDQAAFTIDGEQTTIAVMRIDADVLTTNSAAIFSDDSGSTSSRNSVQVLQDNSAALAATALKIQSDGGITGMQIDKNYTDVAAATVTGLYVDFDRTVPSTGTANFTDIGINLDVNAAGLGTTTTTGMDIDVVGATSGTHTAIGLDVTVGSADTNIAARFTGGEVALLTTTKLSSHDVGGGENIVASADGHLEINSATTLDITAPTVDINASTLVQIDGAVSVGVDDTGHDVKFFGATSGAYMKWNQLTDDLQLVGDAGLDIAGDVDVDGTTNLDIVDIDGAVDCDGALSMGSTITVGVDGTGHDVKFFGTTSGDYMLWDEDEDQLVLSGTMKIKEQADADSDTAAFGQIWVNTATPNELYFTTDAGNDIQLTSGTGLVSGGAGPFGNAFIASWVMGG